MAYSAERLRAGAGLARTRQRRSAAASAAPVRGAATARGRAATCPTASTWSFIAWTPAPGCPPPRRPSVRGYRRRECAVPTTWAGTTGTRPSPPRAWRCGHRLVVPADRVVGEVLGDEVRHVRQRDVGRQQRRSRSTPAARPRGTASVTSQRQQARREGEGAGRTGASASGTRPPRSRARPMKNSRLKMSPGVVDTRSAGSVSRRWRSPTAPARREDQADRAGQPGQPLGSACHDAGAVGRQSGCQRAAEQADDRPAKQVEAEVERERAVPQRPVVRAQRVEEQDLRDHEPQFAREVRHTRMPPPFALLEVRPAVRGPFGRFVRHRVEFPSKMEGSAGKHPGAPGAGARRTPPPTRSR